MIVALVYQNTNSAPGTVSGTDSGWISEIGGKLTMWRFAADIESADDRGGMSRRRYSPFEDEDDIYLCLYFLG